MLRQRRILIVDDEGNLASLVSQAFEHEGYQVATATNGIECMNKVTRFRPDVIVMDIMMPRLDGIDTTRLIRRHDEYGSTLIIALSAKHDDQTQAKMMAAGADAFLAKPFSMAHLMTIVNDRLLASS